MCWLAGWLLGDEREALCHRRGVGAGGRSGRLFQRLCRGTGPGQRGLCRVSRFRRGDRGRPGRLVGRRVAGRECHTLLFRQRDAHPGRPAHRSLGRIIDYVAAGGEPPEILPQGDDWHVLGNRQSARAITVAFVDYASPESAQHALQVLPQLQETYIDTGQLIYVLHPWAGEAAGPSARGGAAAECAGQQGKYWEMHDQLFDEQATWTAAAEPQPLFIGYAEDLGLDSRPVCRVPGLGLGPVAGPGWQRSLVRCMACRARRCSCSTTGRASRARPALRSSRQPSTRSSVPSSLAGGQVPPVGWADRTAT